MAMPNRVKVFPRGYSGGQHIAPPKHAIREGDADISALWKEYTSSDNHSQTWEFRRQVIAAAKRLFSSTNNWWTSQDMNPLLDKYHYDFVVDTLRFIATGRRTIPIYSWPDLLSNYPEVPGRFQKRHDIYDLISKLKLTTRPEELIRAWCSHEKGFDDMVYSLNLLFGDIALRVPSNDNS